MICTRILAILIGLFFCSPVLAQIKSEVFDSYKLLEERRLQIYTPEDYDPDVEYPLIVVLDGEYLFDATVAGVKYYRYWSEIPPCIVVGIDQNYEDIREDDCAFEGRSGLPLDKANLFFEFIGMELIPYLEGQYNLASFKMAIGHTLTANFINYYLFKERSLFDAFVGLSPELAPLMEERLPEVIPSFEQKIFYYLATGEFDDKKKKQRITILNSNLKALQSDNFYYYYDDFPNGRENSIPALGISNALDQIFGFYKPISKAEFKDTLLKLDTPIYAYLEEKYNTINNLIGTRQDYSLNDIMAVYVASKKKEDAESLKNLSDACRKMYEDTMMGYYFLGEHYEMIGQPKKALKAFEKSFIMEEIDFLNKDMAIDKMDAIKADFGY